MDAGRIVIHHSRKREQRAASLVAALLLPQETVLRALELARRDTPAVLYGETGTGKEFVARWIHDNSARSRQPFLPVNLEQINTGVIESELFGHEKGAFTSAHSEYRGRFEAVGSGVLFLDEFTLAIHNGIEKLMRVLETGAFYRIGSTRERKFAGRLLMGMNRHPKTLLDKGLISKDLYYRINKYPLYIPPLRRRKEYILEYVKLLLDKSGNEGMSLAPGDEDFLMRHTFPGNIRELKNLIEHALIIAGTGRTICLEQSYQMIEFVEEDDLPEIGRGLSASGTGLMPGAWDDYEQSNLSMTDYLERCEAALIQQALKISNNCISLAARNLKMCESTLRSKMKKLKRYMR